MTVWTEERVDVALLDWRMPEMNGLVVLQALRQHGIATPTIFLTALSDDLHEEAAPSSGAVATAQAGVESTGSSSHRPGVGQPETVCWQQDAAQNESEESLYATAAGRARRSGRRLIY